MMKYIVLIVGVFLSCSVFASLCEVAYQSGRIDQNISAYEECAISENNDKVMAQLADIYLNGSGSIKKNIQKALLFYHLSAENGNAKSQVALAKLLMQMDAKNTTREQLRTYSEKIKFFMAQTGNGFNGEFLHPIALLMLASEPVDQKWYYVSDELEALEAGRLLKKYKMTEAKRAQMVRAASNWKQRKLFEIAKEVYTPADYQKFENAVRPKKGRTDVFTRDQVIEKLKQDIQKYKEK